MNTSLAWLNQYLDQPIDAAEATARLTAAGFPVEDQAAVTTTAGTDDTCLDVEITSNRPDCLAHTGLAREAAAASGRALIQPSDDLPETDNQPASELTAVSLEAPELCPVYTARVIRGVQVGPSPQWLADRLEAIGLRPINNVVDVTNYVLFELGQPLHAFDLAALDEQRIRVRPAANNEPFEAIDGSRHALSENMLVIADATRPVAIAGVMGGANTEVGDATTDILLESAIFEPLSVRRTSRALKLASDSSFRFERGVDPLGVEQASRRAAALIAQIAGGSVADGVIREGAPEPGSRDVSLRPKRTRSLLGIDIDDATQQSLLDRLGLGPQNEDNTIRCAVPPRRLDLQREVDLIEEVARLHGLDQLDVQEKIHIVARPPQAPVQARQALDRTLAAHGYHETITFSFVDPGRGQAFLPPGDDAVTVEQQRAGESMLRPALLPSLLTCRKANQDLGNRDVQLYEAAASWTKRDGQIREHNRLALLCDAERASDALRELRGTLEELVERLGGESSKRGLSVEPASDDRFQTAAEVTLNDNALGRFGLLSEKLQNLFDLQTPVVAAELELSPLIELYPPTREVGELPRFPGIERDLSVIVDETVTWQRLEQTVRGTDPALLEALTFLDTYRGKPIPKGQKSVSFRMRFRDPEATLRHEQVDPQVSAVIDALKQNAGAELRG